MTHETYATSKDEPLFGDNWNEEAPDDHYEPEPVAQPVTGGSWPTLGGDTYYGLAGDVVQAVGPYTEADPAAVLFGFLSAAGCYLGNTAYLMAGNTQHPGRIWPLLTGATASGAKGTAMAVVQQIIRVTDREFATANRASGLSTSEGLIRRVRNGQGDDPNAKDFDEGVADKRLIVWEPEFANVLSRSRREGNSLSATIRDAYDGVPLQTLVSNNPLHAEGHHIAIIAAITAQELVAKLTASDISNGFANRFLLVCSRRSKLLPDSGDVPWEILTDLANRLREAAKAASSIRQMHRTPGASALWADEYHRRFGSTPDEGPVTTMSARWHAHSARMSVIYALLDGSDVITEKHVRAGLAAWDYAEQSTRYIFTDEASDPDLGRLTEYINGSEVGVSRKSIGRDLFKTHKKKAEMDVLLTKLLKLGTYEKVKVPGDGRPTEMYRRRGAGS